MKRFTVTTTTVVATVFSGREYRAYFGIKDTDDAIAADLADDNGQMAHMIQSITDGLGIRSETAVIDHYTRDIPTQEQP